MSRVSSPASLLQKVCQIHLIEGLPELVVPGIGPAHEEVVPHGALEQIALVADIGDVLHQAVLRNVPQLRAADGHRAGVAPVPAHKDGGNGGLAAARLAHQRDEFSLRDGQIDAVEDLPLRLVGKAQIPAGDAALRAGDAALLRLRQVQQAEDLVAGGHAVHGNVEKGAQLAHGDEKVRRQQDDEQRTRKVDFPCAKLRCGHDDAERRAAVGDKVHDGDGVELHGENLHGDFAELFGLRVHLVILEARQPDRSSG